MTRQGIILFYHQPLTKDKKEEGAGGEKDGKDDRF